MPQDNTNYEIERELAARKGQVYRPAGDLAAPAPAGVNPNAPSAQNPNAASRMPQAYAQPGRPAQQPQSAGMPLDVFAALEEQPAQARSPQTAKSAVPLDAYTQPGRPAQQSQNAGMPLDVFASLTDRPAPAQQPVPRQAPSPRPQRPAAPREDATTIYRNPPPARAPREDATTLYNNPAPARAAGTDDRTRVSRPPQKAAGNGNGRGAGGKGGGRSGGGNGGGGKGSAGKGGKASRKKTMKYVLKNMLKTAFVLGCVLVIVLSFMAISVAQYLVEATADDDLILNLETRKTAQTGYILAKDPTTGEWLEYQKLVSESNSIWVPLHQISPYLKDAVISTEDREFESHGGFSVKRTAFAAFNEVFHVRDNTFGASTIDQQLVKNLTGEKEVVGADGEKGAGYQRKMREIYRAVGLNNRYSKDMILEAYLNTLPLSGTIVGVQAAAKEYFYKDVWDLELHEAAMIAGITQFPTQYNPYNHPENCKDRRNDVLFFMYDNGKITEEEMLAACALPLGLYEGARQEDAFANEAGVNSYFSDTVFEAVVGDLVEQGVVESREAAIRMYYNGGLRIESTVDLTLQTEMERVYELGWGEGGLFPESVTTDVEVENDDGTVTTQTVHPQSSMAVMDYNGELKGIVGGIGPKTESLVLNRAYQSPRPIGSTMKPLTSYALGIDYNLITYSSMLMDAAVASRNPSSPTRDAEGNVVFDWPYNYGESTSNNVNVLVCDAVASSKNTVPALVATWLGKETLYSHLQDTLEISTLMEGENYDLNYAPLVLGALSKGISAYELAAAYAIFGGTDSYGVFNSPHCYTRVLDAFGNVVLQPQQITVQAIKPESAYVVNRLLSGVLRGNGGTARGMALNYMDSVAKTGTTTDDKDRWFVGLTPYYISAVWWGYDTNQEINWSAAASTNPPPNVWKSIMETVQADKPEMAFPAQPEGVVERKFCRESGLIASENCPDTQLGYYTSENVPEVCTLHTGEA